MPVVNVDPDELRRLVGLEKDDDTLREDLFSLGVEFEGWTEDDEFQLEFAPDRLDRLSVEGIARSLRYHYGEDRGVYVPSTNDAEWTIEVDDPPPERPYVTGVIIRGLDLDEAALESLIQVQEKLHATMGRQRAKGAIGVHDLTMLKGAPATDGTSKSITYSSMPPDEGGFVPLDSDEEMTPAEVLEHHHMGSDYADLVADMDRYPAIYDDIGLFSFPPVINGRRTEVTADSRDLLVEMTGTDQWTIDHMCNIVAYSLEARGARIEDVEVVYADDAPGEYAGRTLDRPDFSTKTKRVAHERIESIIGVEFSVADVVDCLERSGLEAAELHGVDSGDGRAGEDVSDEDVSDEGVSDEGVSGEDVTGEGLAGGGARYESADAYTVEIPPYRVDVLHPIDVIDDVGRAYGFNDIEPEYPDVSTVGGRHERSRLEDATRDALVGLGFQDLLNFYMINEAENYDRMNIAPNEDVPADSGPDNGSSDSGSSDNGSADTAQTGTGLPVTIKEPYSEEYTILRTWALPSIMMVLENNTHRAYPQHLAEIGLAAERDESENTNVAEHRTVAGAIAETDASYEDARARLQVIAQAFDKSLETPPASHPTFIEGRTADVVLDGEVVGVIGEVHPAVLVDHDLEVPVSAFEFRLDALK